MPSGPFSGWQGVRGVSRACSASPPPTISFASALLKASPHRFGDQIVLANCNHLQEPNLRAPEWEL